MALDDTKIHLGLQMDQTHLRFIEIEKDHRINVVTAGEVALSVPFDLSHIGNRDALENYSTAVTSILDRFAISARKVSITLERRMVLLKRLKVDHDLSEAELKQQVEWELDQILVEQRDEYNVNYERLSRPGEKFDFAIVAAVRKAIINTIKDIFNHTPLKLTLIDIDILSSIRGLLISISEKPKGLAAIAKMSEDVIDFTILNEGSYLASSTLPVRHSQTGPDSVSDEKAIELASTINEELLRLLDNMGDEVLLKNIEHIYLCNGKPKPKLLESLQKLQRSARIDYIEPLQNLDHSLDQDAESVIKENPGKFLPIFGLFTV